MPEDEGFSARLNPENYMALKQSNAAGGYIHSPSKRALESYQPLYDSPSKSRYQDLPDYQRIPRATESPNKLRERNPQYYDSPSNYSKFVTYNKSYEINELQQRMRSHFSPERRRPTYQLDPRVRSTSTIEPQAQPQRLLGNYERLHPSTTELSQELDNKIMAIRKKYSQYTRDGAKNHKVSASTYTYMDENVGVSRYTPNPESNISSIKSFYGRGSHVGIGVKKLNSLRDVY